MQKRQSFVPPAAVQRAARRGLELRQEYGRGGLSNSEASSAGIGSGVQRARNLANGDGITLATVRRMRAFFERHEGNNRPGQKENDGGPTAGTIAWLLWGGDPGRRWANSIVEREDSAEKGIALECEVEKVDERLGVVFGYAIVCKVGGEDYFDTQGDHIPEASMLRATAEFMAGQRMAKVMHRGDAAGQVVYGFPMTSDIAKAMGIEVQKTGFLVGMKPDDEEVLRKYASGEYTGFSIGGRRLSETVLEDED